MYSDRSSPLSLACTMPSARRSSRAGRAHGRPVPDAIRWLHLRFDLRRVSRGGEWVPTRIDQVRHTPPSSADAYNSRMAFNPSLTELTTSVTDGVLAIEAVLAIVWLRRGPNARSWRTTMWSWVFGLVACSSFLGTVVHGLDLSEFVHEAIWKPLYLSLGILVAMFAVGAIADWRGWAFAKRLVPWGIVIGTAFYGLTELLNGAFNFFVVYEGVALVSAFAIYSYLAATARLDGAAIVAVAILVNLIAAGLQASTVSINIIVPLNHNGVFHLVQMIGTALLAVGIRRGMSNAPANPATIP